MSRSVGDTAEELAARHLVRRGYRIVARNFTARRGELDLVAVDGDTLCFIEVRARTAGAAEETIGPLKQRRVASAAARFLTTWKQPDMPCRFDVVAIDLGPKPEIRLHRDAFRL
jgi:putative endonuclease